MKNKKRLIILATCVAVIVLVVSVIVFGNKQANSSIVGAVL